jgi:hypothetical protein
MHGKACRSAGGCVHQVNGEDFADKHHMLRSILAQKQGGASEFTFVQAVQLRRGQSPHLFGGSQTLKIHSKSSILKQGHLFVIFVIFNTFGVGGFWQHLSCTHCS